MESSTVECSFINIFEEERKNPSSAADDDEAAPPSWGGLIEVRIRLWHQLWIKAYKFEHCISDVTTPTFVNCFSMPLTFLLPELSVSLVSEKLRSIHVVDPRVCDILSPKIAEFAVDVAKRRGPTKSFLTVAEVEVKKIDYILDQEFDRITKTIYAADLV
ncbi:hypothetical protein CCACVL1_08019 [Corchorus capsularis]|uniref:Uncharacterized protein n=1 Tax=Corchorus capsularis TaxID=210143 RepID=A0A1R3J2V4_COCAP|nr:hypothetical protein CCACVL1_08019 [Corchorus capsularis]